ncbi:TerB N-terminal domain-containing protein [Marinobacterium sedimentorum]|uniref:tellurite resistance TerB family protein n=1 Tax=Marinobacterium sedimentorum TaxID=2927804 RepID=UPI0020C5C4DD|nr:TerB N-terminal domain-containing protein [Marinobacterium sedimentorum]MCP8687657.1 TerB N-terminal domain-containing protein [Marinobacterium sedimentorum]
MEWIVGAVILYFLIKLGASSSKKKAQATTKSPMSKKASGNSLSPSITVTVSTRSGSRSQEQSYDMQSDFRLTNSFDQDINEPVAGRWVPLGESVSVGDSLITLGGFYLRDSNTIRGNKDEPSLVDATLGVTSSTYLYEDPGVGYYPRFRELSPRGMGAYLGWLASSRDDSKTPITYVFLYFYGIERRFLVDHLQAGQALDKSELRALFKELNRLKSVFFQNQSFKGYATRLMDLMILLHPDLFLNIKQPFISGRNSLSLRYQIGLCARMGAPVGPALAYGWIRYHPEYSIKMPARRCDEAFKKLFKLRYKEKYGAGIKVQPNKRRLELRYRPASVSLLYADLSLPELDVPDPFELVGPMRKLSEVADAVTEELVPLSRYLGKEGNRPDDIEASLLIPKQLLNDKLPPVLSKFAKALKQHIDTRNEMYPVAKLWELLGKPAPAKINKAEVDLLTRTLDNLDIGFAPDPRVHHIKPDSKGTVALFRQTHSDKEAITSSLLEYATVVRLGTMIAAQSGTEGQEAKALKQVIDSNIHLSAPDKSSLHAYLRWSMQAPINMNGIKKRVGDIDQEQCTVLSKLLVGIAMADGHASSDEIRQLERIYTALGLDKTMVTRDIHEVSGFSIKQREQATQPARSVTPKMPAEFALDEAVLALHESETRHAQSMLSKIFSDDSAEEETDDNAARDDLTAKASAEVAEQLTADTEDDGGEFEGLDLFSGLDEPHATLLNQLLAKPRWDRNEVESLAKAQSLMTDGALEVLNDWSYDQVEEPLIEDGGDIIEIDQDTLNEINSMRGQD